VQKVQMNTSNHAFRDFDQSLQGLESLLHLMLDKIGLLGEACQAALNQREDKDGVASILKQARALDKEVNQLEDEITRLIQGIFSKYNPRGQDLRFVITSVKISTLLESIADKSKNCIKRLFKTESSITAETATHITQMLADTQEITPRLHLLLKAYAEDTASEITRFRKKIEQSYRAIWAAGTRVDADYHNIVMLAKNIERIADMAVDVRKLIYYIHTGEKRRKKKATSSDAVVA
jgi:phosphate uptake regulator